jgi:peroxiredoxin
MQKLTMTSLLFILLLGFTFQSCDSNPKGLSIKGTLSDATNISVSFEQIIIGENARPLQSTTTDGQGNFEFHLENSPNPGIYRIRVGAQGGDIVLTGEEREITIKGTLSDLASNIFEIEGSEASTELLEAFQKVVNREFTQLEQIKTHVEGMEHAYSATHFAIRSLQSRPEYTEVHEIASAKLIRDYPGTTDAENYAGLVSQLKEAQAQQTRQAQGPIRVGMEAPEIEMEGADGKTYRLSDLRGNVVLLDFWAAWCRPCRIANPAIVDVYNRYKNQGFKVFNVSLDGIDSRTAARFSGENELQQQIEVQRQRWLEAIQQDNLDWPYHVSNLKRWECEAARAYGVTAIPRYYLIDREGKIAVINPRAQTDLERELKKLL